MRFGAGGPLVQWPRTRNKIDQQLLNTCRRLLAIVHVSPQFCAQLGAGKTYILMGEPAALQVPALRPFPIGSLCERGDSPAGRLGLTTVPVQGQLLVVCRLCWLCVNVRSLATGGDVSSETIASIEEVLSLSCQRLREELEEVHGEAAFNS